MGARKTAEIIQMRLTALLLLLNHGVAVGSVAMDSALTRLGSVMVNLTVRMVQMRAVALLLLLNHHVVVSSVPMDYALNQLGSAMDKTTVVIIQMKSTALYESRWRERSRK